MREIRIENVTAQNIVHIILAFKDHEFLMRKKTVMDGKLSFITRYDGKDVETVIKFKPYCAEFYKIDRVTVGGTLIYGNSSWVGKVDQVIIDAE